MQGVDRNLPIDVYVGKTSEIIEIADCALMKSGSVSLEMMARGTPCTVVYHASRSTYTLGRMLTNIKYMSLPNFIADDKVMPEYIAVGRSTERTIADATKSMSQLIGDPVYRSEQRARLQNLAREHAQPGAANRAAEIILSDLAVRCGEKSLVTTVQAA